MFLKNIPNVKHFVLSLQKYLLKYINVASDDILLDIASLEQRSQTHDPQAKCGLRTSGKLRF